MMVELLAPRWWQQALDANLRQEIAAYVARRNKRSPVDRTTLADVCKRFRLSRAEAKRLIETSDRMSLSDYAYKPPPADASPAEIMAAAWRPTHWPDAPAGRKLVILLDDD